jgi:biofilm PGA synthesis N-glycosyltransferase PgaC
MKLGLPFSITVLFWMIAGIARYIYEEKLSKKRHVKQAIIKKKTKKVAVCIPAYNEEAVIEKPIKSAKKLVAPEQIYVVSDGSTDQTAKIAERLQVNLLELMPGRGKARALVALIERFKLLQRYQFILFLDADTLINSQYLKRALRMFETHPYIVSIAGYAITPWRKHKIPSQRRFISAYRLRLNYMLQLSLVYGYSWKFFNAPFVIPGGCSIYKTSVLAKLHLDTPGILIEDFNLAFQINKKKLGKIGHLPSIYIFDEEPKDLKDYWNQVRRWNIGFFQTVRKNGIWPSLFWLSIGFFSLEVSINALIITLLPILALILTAWLYLELIRSQTVFSNLAVWRYFTFIWAVIITLFIMDYSITLFTAIRRKKPLLAIYGLGFLFFRYLDSLIVLSALPEGLFSKSVGKWRPPSRI